MPDIDDEPGNDCRHASGNLRTLFAATDYVSGDEFEVTRCASCDAVFTRPLPQGEEWSRYYPPAYYRTADGKRFPGPVEFLQRQLYAARARSVERMLDGRRGRVLDVGCGPGYLLKAFQRRGWETMGTELSGTAAAFAREELGLNVESRELAELKLPDSQFDAVVIWHALEHIPQPEALLREIARVLRPGGVLMVGVPNWGSPESQLAGSKWFQLDVPRHVNHFTAEKLGRDLEAAGLEIRKRGFLAPEFDFFSFVQTSLNRAGLKQNLLYNLLRRRAGKVAAENVPWWQTAATIALTPLLSLVALPIVLLAAFLNEGGSMTFHAVKRGR